MQCVSTSFYQENLMVPRQWTESKQDYDNFSFALCKVCFSFHMRILDDQHNNSQPQW
jgi:hypothetical protein